MPRLADYALFRAMTPGCVIVADPGEPHRTGFWGDLMSAAAQTSGATGIVIDGRARDSRELVKMADFAVFCRGTTMSSTERRVNTVDFQIPVAIARRVRAPGRGPAGRLDLRRPRRRDRDPGRARRAGPASRPRRPRRARR